MSQLECDRRLSESNPAATYMLSLGNGFVVDASKYGNVSRFINHSCDPNCRVEFLQVNGQVAGELSWIPCS